MEGNEFVRKLLGGSIGERTELARLANPISYITPSCPPFLIIHGTQDQNVPFEQATLLRDALVSADSEVTFVPLEGKGHLPVNPPPELYQTMCAFFAQYLLGAG